MPVTPIRDYDVVTTGRKESLSLVTTTPPSVAQSPALAPSPPTCTITYEDNILTNPIDVSDELRNSDDDDFMAKRPWINYPTYNTCVNSQ